MIEDMAKVQTIDILGDAPGAEDEMVDGRGAVGQVTNAYSENSAAASRSPYSEASEAVAA
ncbi:hypothetical protein [Fulvimarina pelagi]|nr:hypothetical protein [Fulvimarina pelagi]BAT31089.1 hypothetical protein [Fulvimarina pelagi]